MSDSSIHPDRGFFFELTPDRVLESVEQSGLLCTGRCMALNSFENRVYDVELELSDSELNSEKGSGSPFKSDRRIVKFYRPGRWTENQIIEEHQFLADLQEAEIPAIAPLPFPDGRTLHQTRDSGIYYSIFPKVGGRSPDELSDEQLVRVGRLLARIHGIGRSRVASHRLRIDPQTYGYSNLEFLIENRWIPVEFESRYRSTVTEICKRSEVWFRSAQFQRIHGDCHFGNLLWNQSGPFFVDFDDMVIGPPVQDVWLLVPGRDSEAIRQREVFLSGYEDISDFDRSTFRLIEPLRALRFVHYSAWIARRWDDPAFPLAFPHFGTHQYWSKEVEDLEKQLNIIQNVDSGPNPF